MIIVLNPAAKGERAAAVEERIRALLPEAELRRTRDSGDATRVTREAIAEGHREIVAAGGDGTINEVVNGMAESGATLAVLPVGTMNVFALELGIPASLEKAAEIAREGLVRQVDLARANGRYFVQLAGVGLDAETVRNTDLQSKKQLGPLSYVLSCAQVLTRPAPVLTLHNGGGDTRRGSFVLVGNGRFYGGPFAFFPQASLFDGQLDVCVFHRQSHFDLLRYLRGILAGCHVRFSDVEYFKTTHLTVTSEEPVPFEVDGELYGECPVTFAMADQRLAVRTPHHGQD